MKKVQSTDKNIAVLYHADCKDGFGAAWAAWKKFGDSAEYIPVFHGRPVPDGLTGKEIYMLDFTYPEDITRELMAANTRVTAIDHHASEEKVTKLTHDSSFDIKHSGAVLAWRYFHPDQRTPELLSHIEDQDLWNFKLTGTLELNTYINALEREFPIWDRLAQEFEDPKIILKYSEEGKLLVQYNDRLMREIAKDARLVNFLGHKVFMVNAPHRFASAIARILYEKTPFSIIWNEKRDRIGVSLRARLGAFDVSVLAQQFGGGGHPQSAGFSLPLDSKLPWKTIKD
jgi:oligoribonuclease NrnB/cAMP/cGMP phosphodiesterase (DHH superfamily)